MSDLNGLYLPPSIRRRIGLAPGTMGGMWIRFGAPDPLDEPGGYRYEISEPDRKVLEQAVKDARSKDANRKAGALGAIKNALRTKVAHALAGIGGSAILNMLGLGVYTEFTGTNAPTIKGQRSRSGGTFADVRHCDIVTVITQASFERANGSYQVTIKAVNRVKEFARGNADTRTGPYYYYGRSGNIGLQGKLNAITLAFDEERLTEAEWNGGPTGYGPAAGATPPEGNPGKYTQTYEGLFTGNILDGESVCFFTADHLDGVRQTEKVFGQCPLPNSHTETFDPLGELEDAAPNGDLDPALSDFTPEELQSVIDDVKASPWNQAYGGSPEQDPGDFPLPDPGITPPTPEGEIPLPPPIDPLDPAAPDPQDSQLPPEELPNSQIPDGELPPIPQPEEFPGASDVVPDPDFPSDELPGDELPDFPLTSPMDDFEITGGQAPTGEFTTPLPDDFFSPDTGRPNKPYLPGGDFRAGTDTAPIFDGRIDEVELNDPPGTGTFRGSAPPYTDETFTKNRCYKNRLITDIVKELATQDLGMNAATTLVSGGCQKRFTGCFAKGTSKFDAMWKLADRCGYGVYPDPGGGGEIGPTTPLNVHHGPYHEDRDLFVFSPVYDNFDLYGAVEVYRPHFPDLPGFSVVAPVDGTVYGVSADKVLRIEAERGMTQLDAIDLAAYKARELARRTLRIEAAVPYNRSIKGRHQAVIQRPSRRFRENYMITEYRHELKSDGWVTIFQGVKV